MDYVPCLLVVGVMCFELRINPECVLLCAYLQLHSKRYAPFEKLEWTNFLFPNKDRTILCCGLLVDLSHGSRCPNKGTISSTFGTHNVRNFHERADRFQFAILFVLNTSKYHRDFARCCHCLRSSGGIYYHHSRPTHTCTLTGL